MEMERGFQEINQYDDSMFPVGIYVVTKESIIPRGRGFRDFHWHEELQITLALEGDLTIRVHTRDYELKEGEGIFINRNLLHAVTCMSEHGKYASLNFPEKLLSFFPGSRMEQKDVLPYTGGNAFEAVALERDIPWQKKLLDLAQQSCRVLAKRQTWEATGEEIPEYQVAVNLVHFWMIFLQNMSGQMQPPARGDIRKRERIQTMLSFIQENYMTQIRLEDIAASASVSPGECCRSFKSFFGRSPGRYLSGYRIMKSQELLSGKGSAFTVTEAVLAVGFCDTSYFIQCFKKETGMTPGEYRDRKC